jgi:hypothetical protein
VLRFLVVAAEGEQPKAVPAAALASSEEEEMEEEEA